MTNIIEKKCVPCEGGVPPLTHAQVTELYKETPLWKVAEGEKMISRDFVFKNFKEAMFFINKIANLAESEGHHPDLSISWNKVRIALTTHAIGGLSENDFIVAAKIDRI
jgi:4a-hydroxytetrahydrobiopterin dehydratase